jgi:dipeptidyl aminopeptidase/acylaminoacyl peptidase
VDYRSGVDGQSDWALHLPPRSVNTWVVVFHGHGSGGDQLYVRADAREFWLNPLRNAGAGIITPNLRGNSWMSPPAVQDLHDLLTWFAKRHQASRFVFASGSMGGTSNLIYATFHPEDCAAVAVWGAAPDLAGYVKWGMRYARGIQREIAEAIVNAYGGTAEQVPDLYRRHSPLLHTDRLIMPLYLSHGEKDALMPVAPMRELAARLVGRETVTWVEIPAGDHDSPAFQTRARDWLPQGLLVPVKNHSFRR